MKKRILSVLLGCSLLVGTVFTNAVSIEFEEIDNCGTDNVINVYAEKTENSNSPLATEIEDYNLQNVCFDFENKENQSLDIYENTNNITTLSETESLISYIMHTNDIYYQGNNFMESNNFGTFVYYTNTSIDDTKYIIYRNAIQNGSNLYDLVIYPFNVIGTGGVKGDEPGFSVKSNSTTGFKMYVTKHNNISEKINLNIIIGFTDLDIKEFVTMPSDFKLIHKGSKISENNGTYTGITECNNNNPKEMYDSGAVLGMFQIPEDGTVIYYGSSMNSGRTTWLVHKPIQEYVNQNAYTIEFNHNGGSGNAMRPIIKFGSTSSLMIGNISNTVPTRTGYTFKGWSATPELNEKRVAYDIGNTGAVQTSDLWTYENYCHYTGGDSSNRTLTLYAQWEVNQYPITYIDVDENDNEIGRTTRLADYDTFVKGSDIGDDKTDNAYYSQYRYVSDTSTKVTTDGVVVYRIFKFCETEAKSNLQWNDNNNADGFRPEKYKLKLKQNGKVIDETELSSDQTNYTFPNLPKYDSNGNAYKYSFDVDASNRYQIVFDEDGNLIVEEYLPANFSVTIPKIIVLDGNKGNADYAVLVNGTFYYNDTLTVIPESSLTLTDRSKISSMQADISQQKTVFMKEDGVASGTSANGSIQVDRSNFAGIWKGHFNFDIKFKMQN